MTNANFKAARLACGLSQVEVSAKIGRPQSIISKIENGAIEPDLDTLIKIKKLYKTTYDFLLEGKKGTKKRTKTTKIHPDRLNQNQ